MYYARIRNIELQVNPQESVIYIPNIDPTYSAPLARNIPRGMQIPCTSDGLKFLDAPIGKIQYAPSNCKNIMSQVENDLTVLRQFPHLHQRLKLLIFCTNTRLMYFLRTIPAEIFTENVQQSDDSIDNFLADTFCFPENYKTVNLQCYTNALNQIRIRDSSFGCYRNLPMIDAAQNSALADASRWFQKYSIIMPWLSAPDVHLLQDTIRPFVINLQQWELPLGHECPSAEIQNESALPLQIPSPEFIPHWPGLAEPLIPKKKDFARQIKSKLKYSFIADLS